VINLAVRKEIQCLVDLGANKDQLLAMINDPEVGYDSLTVEELIDIVEGMYA